MKGKLKIVSDETHELLFVSDDGKTKQGFKSCKEHNNKWFCASTSEQAHKGIPATWNPESQQLMTDDWHNRRTTEFLGRTDMRVRALVFATFDYLIMFFLNLYVGFEYAVLMGITLMLYVLYLLDKRSK